MSFNGKVSSLSRNLSSPLLFLSFNVHKMVMYETDQVVLSVPSDTMSYTNPWTDMCHNVEGWVSETCQDRGTLGAHVDCLVALGTFLVITRTWLHAVLWRLVCVCFGWSIASHCCVWLPWIAHILSFRVVMLVPSIFLLFAGAIRLYILGKRDAFPADMTRNWLYFVKMASIWHPPLMMYSNRQLIGPITPRI